MNFFYSPQFVEKEGLTSFERFCSMKAFKPLKAICPLASRKLSNGRKVEQYGARGRLLFRGE
jgi:hypothetical protein